MRSDRSLRFKDSGSGRPGLRPARDHTLNGSAPDDAPVALLLIDVINTFSFPGGADLLDRFLPAARRIAALKVKARRAGIPSVYVNDNFGRWRSDFNGLVDRCLGAKTGAASVAKLLRPKRNDYFILKPKHSGFFCTSLELLLEHLGVHTLIVAGIATDVCVLSTATDAYMRDFALIVPSDCVAAMTDGEDQWALRHMRDALGAAIVESTSLRLPALLKRAAAKRTRRH